MQQMMCTNAFLSLINLRVHECVTWQATLITVSSCVIDGCENGFLLVCDRQVLHQLAGVVKSSLLIGLGFLGRVVQEHR